MATLLKKIHPQNQLINDDDIFDQIYIIVLFIRRKNFWSNVLNWLPVIAEGGTDAKIWHVKITIPCDVCDVFQIVSNQETENIMSSVFKESAGGRFKKMLKSPLVAAATTPAGRGGVLKKMVNKKKCLKGSWRRCYYPHWARDSLSPVCGIFSNCLAWCFTFLDYLEKVNTFEKYQQE